MKRLAQDIRYGLRSLRKSPGFALLVILTLGLGIGANTAIFSVVYGVLLRPLPYPQPDRIIQLSVGFNGEIQYSGFDNAEFEFWKAHGQPFEYLAATTPAGFNLAGGNEPLRVRALRVSKDYFRVMGVLPALGREFSADEDALHGPNVAILSYGLWKAQFGGAPSLIGRRISLNGAPYTVVGIMPAGFQVNPAVDLWTTLGQVSNSIGNGINYSVIGRLGAEVSRSQADGYLSTVKNQFLSQYRTHLASRHQSVAFLATPLRSMIAASYRTPLLILFGAIGFVLLIACVNVANLLLSRSGDRGKEIAIRAALGASRPRIFSQLLTESVVLAVLGGALGLLLASWGLNALLALTPADLPRAHDISLDRWALAFTLLASLATGVLFGVVPAFQLSRVDLHGSLKEAAGRATSGISRRRLGSVLAAAEIALSLVLLTGAGLLIETFANLLRVNPGFDPRPVLTLETWTTGRHFATSASSSGFFQKAADPAAISRFYQGILDKVQAIPGVQSAAVVGAGLPLDFGGNVGVWLASEGDSKAFSSDFRSITPDYFKTMGIPFLQGRTFSSADSPAAAKVAIINQEFVHEKFPNRDAIGERIVVDDTPCEIVGVVGDVKSSLGDEVPPTVFIPLAQDAGEIQGFQNWFPVAIVLRTAQPPLSLSRPLETAVHSADPDLPTGRIQSMDQILSASLAFQKFLMTLMTIFAGLAMALAAVGIYGVMAYSVSQRTHEIGIRMAIGARPGDVMRMVVGQGMRVALAGLVVGLAGTLAATRLLSGVLYGVKPADPLILSLVIALLGAIALLACYVPSRRAAAVDPLAALRYE